MAWGFQFKRFSAKDSVRAFSNQRSKNQDTGTLFSPVILLLNPGANDPNGNKLMWGLGKTSETKSDLRHRLILNRTPCIIPTN